MSFLPLTLGVGSLAQAGGEGVKPLAKPQTDKILKRDDYTCRFCGFRATEFQRVTPTADGLVTSCIFCDLAQNLERAGSTGGGILIWLPEISQIELNHIARALYVARAADNEAMTGLANRALDALTARRTEAKKRLGSDDPLLLATILLENLGDEERKAAIAKLDGIRLLPQDKYMVRSKSGDINGFPQLVKFWRSPQGPFAKLPVAEWQSMFAKAAA